MRHYVAGFLVDKLFGRVLLIRKTKPAWQSGRLNAIGGKIEPDESPVEAMVREFHEETGLLMLSSEWTPTVVLHGADYVVHFFVAYGGPSDLLAAKSMTEEQVEAHDLYQLPSGVLDNIRWLLPLSLDRDIAFPLVVRDVTAQGQGQTRAAA